MEEPKVVPDAPNLLDWGTLPGIIDESEDGETHGSEGRPSRRKPEG